RDCAPPELDVRCRHSRRCSRAFRPRAPMLRCFVSANRMRIEIVGLSTMPEVRPGDDLAELILEAAERERQSIDSSVVLTVAQKVVSKAEGAMVDLRQIRPSALAHSWAADWGKDPCLIEVILQQSRRIVKMDRGVLIAETRHGFVCANAGVDQSNIEGEHLATVLPH